MFSHRIEDGLELRPVDERHAEELTALVRRDLLYLMKWMPWATDRYSVEDAREFIRRNLRQYAEDQGFATLIFFRERLVGSIGYNNIDWANRKTDIGYWLAADLQGRGIMTKSVGVLVEYAFRQLRLNRVEIFCAVENTRSRRIPERLGFTEEGTHRQAEWVHDHYKDLVAYSMLAGEWKRLREKLELGRMPLINLQTLIHAPAAVCFDAARSIDLHVSAPSPLRHRAVAGVTSGLIELGEEVTWEGSFFGIRQRMTSKIVALDAPRTFTDEMQRGPFKRWRHTHRFEPTGDGTLVSDHVEFASPFGPIGSIFDALFLKRFMTRVLVEHNRYIKQEAEHRAASILEHVS